jgi:hypothetical protein
LDHGHGRCAGGCAFRSGLTDAVTRELFHVRSSAGERTPATAHVAVKYPDDWIHVDKRDADSMSTV